MTASSTTIATDSRCALLATARGDCVLRPGADPLEAQLIRESRDGCHEAYRLLVERHQDAIYHFCFQWLGCSEDAREACQDTFVRAYNALPRYRPEARFSTWLYRIALNLCRDRARSGHHRRRKAQVDLPENLPCHRPGPDEATMLDADLLRLREAIAALPDRLREVIVLCCLKELSHLECAHIVGCSARAVEGRLYRARRILLASWNREE